MGYFRKDGGAISVFLIIILVPCMLIASIFVDISRVQLAKAVAESSADLALSTLMSNYDYDLCAYYGLMGSCQDIDQYYDIVAEYYDTALHSRDVEEEEIQLLYQRVMNEYGDRFGSGETISDILRIQNITEGAVISSLEGANMYNASILQEQIVEFMKYRAPMEILLGIIERLGLNEDADTQEILNGVKNSGGVSDVGESDVNHPLVDNKTSFYEAEGKLLKTAFEVYWLTRDYTDEVERNGMSADKQRQYAQQLVNYREAYRQIHFYLVANLMNTQGLTGEYKRVTIDLDSYSYYDEKNPEIYTRMETSTPPPTVTSAPDATAAPTTAPTSSQEPVYYISKKRVEDLRSELQGAIDGFDTAIENYVAACRERNLIDVLPGTEDNQAYAVQWWVQMNNAVNGSDGNLTAQLRESAEALVKAYAKVKAMGGCTPESDVPSDWLDANGILIDANGALIEEARHLHEIYLTEPISNVEDDYLKLVNRLEQVSRDNHDNIQAAKLYVSVDGGNRSLPDAVTYMQRQLNDMQDTVQSYIGLLDKLLYGVGGLPSQLDLLEMYAGSYASNLEHWSDSADSLSTNLAAEHRDEIDKVKNLQNEDKDSTTICVEIDRQAVQDMRSRLSDIRSQYQIISDAIATMQYGNRKLQEIMNVETMKECAGAVVQTDAIGLTNRQVREYADTTFYQLFTPTYGDIAVLHDAGESSYNPLINPDTGQVDTPDLYRYLHGQFKDKDSYRDKVEEKEKEQEEADKQKKEKEEEKNRNRYHGGGGNIKPTKKSGGNAFDLGTDAVKGLTGIIRNLGSGDFDNILNNVYTLSYIMNMFSYATYENEGCYRLLDEDQQTKLILKNSSIEGTEYTKAYQEKMGSEDTPKSWLSTKLSDSYNKTLTNRMINKENNVAYLAEVEYILYGGSTNEENVRRAYGDIYAIRYVLNLISAFSNFWGRAHSTGRLVNNIAGAVMEMTAGIIPSALTKVILLPILAVFETCRDLDRLEAGFPVELYKAGDDWWYGFDDENMKSVSEFMAGLTGEKKNPGQGLYYSDYLTLFVYLGLQGDQKTAEQMYLRMADVIQANMGRATRKDGSDEKDSYSLTNTQVYFRLKSKLRVEPLMIALPLFEDYIEDPTMKDDWCTFEIEAVRGY